MTSDLAARARRAGVALSYEDWAGKRVDVAAESVERVLAALGAPPVHAPGAPGGAEPGADDPDTADSATANPGPEPTGHPLTAVPRVPPGTGRLWGWQLQLYQLRSETSWGIGDYRDLTTAARAFAAQGADAILVNPLHAMTPPAPGESVQNSPYFPSSRRFCDQLGIAIEELAEYAAATPERRAEVSALRPPNSERIDRDAVWSAKRAALALLKPSDAESSDAAAGGPDPVVRREFGVFCALAEVHGGDWRNWPEELRRPGVAASAAADPRQVELHVWMQEKARGQLLAAQTAATEAGMTVGLIHDLAVGVDPGGADAWSSQDELASDFTIGAPPDSFNQLGQDWGLPPWRPDRLAATNYAPLREVARAALSLGGGLRVDHVMGLFRLWWVPPGESAREGTYVSYDGRAMLDVITSEAAAVGAMVIGEDLGTVAAAVTEGLTEADVLGSAVLWFETDADGVPLPAASWRESAAASVSTHDLPTASGQIAGEPARVRAGLGQLGHSLAAEQERAGRAQAQLEDRLRTEGLLTPGASTAEIVEAMHRMLLRSPSRLVLFAPADAVGDLRQPNLPGTTDAYPNWRLPLADGAGVTVGLEAFLAHPVTGRLAALAREHVGARVGAASGGTSTVPPDR